MNFWFVGFPAFLVFEKLIENDFGCIGELISERFDAFTHCMFFFLTTVVDVLIFNKFVVGGQSQILKYIATELITGANKVSIQVRGVFRKRCITNPEVPVFRK